jgi:hypothetical protein
MVFRRVLKRRTGAMEILTALRGMASLEENKIYLYFIISVYLNIWPDTKDGSLVVGTL